ncbi:MAG: hypothetical protein JNN12_10080 [Bacteroidetes Order II. Incertae sedis bacterium]|nr:hypothetical protein [Bacteroidetes Order II. bacterium]
MKQNVLPLALFTCMALFPQVYPQALEQKFLGGAGIVLLGTGDHLAKGSYAGYQHPINPIFYVPIHVGHFVHTDFKWNFDHITLVYGNLGIGIVPVKYAKFSLELESGVTARRRSYLQTTDIGILGEGIPPKYVKHNYIDQMDAGWFLTFGLNHLASDKIDIKILALLQSYRTGTPVAGFKIQGSFKVKK